MVRSSASYSYVRQPKLDSLLKNSSMFPSELHSRAQSPAFAAFRPCFALIATPFRSRDRSDNDFFNKLWTLAITPHSKGRRRYPHLHCEPQRHRLNATHGRSLLGRRFLHQGRSHLVARWFEDLVREVRSLFKCFVYARRCTIRHLGYERRWQRGEEETHQQPGRRCEPHLVARRHKNSLHKLTGRGPGHLENAAERLQQDQAHLQHRHGSGSRLAAAPLGGTGAGLRRPGPPSHPYSPNDVE
jgi:hypothetical protein